MRVTSRLPEQSHHEAFEACVRRAVDSLPPALSERVENVEIVIEEAHDDDAGLLGLYQGVPLTARTAASNDMQPPDRIAVYRRPLVAEFGTVPELLVQQIRVTVLHELGHYFGMSEERLAALGFD